MQRMSAAEYRKLGSVQTQPGKYGNKRVREDGHTFASKAEHARYQELKLLQRGGKISELRVHTRFPLDVNGRRISTYESDFDYREILRVVHGEGVQSMTLIVEDVKGHATADYKIKRELFKALYPDADFRELKL